MIHKLKQEGNKIYIITARKNNDKWFPISLKNVEDITKKWLQDNHIEYDKILFDVQDKGKSCKENHIDIMIEDDPVHSRKLMDNTNIIIFDYPYNRNQEFLNVTRAYSWYDIYHKITNENK